MEPSELSARPTSRKSTATYWTPYLAIMLRSSRNEGGRGRDSDVRGMGMELGLEQGYETTEGRSKQCRRVQHRERQHYCRHTPSTHSHRGREQRHKETEKDVRETIVTILVGTITGIGITAIGSEVADVWRSQNTKRNSK